MKRWRQLAMVLLAASAAALMATPRAPSWTLETVLKQLDETARSFRSLTADVERTKVTVVVNDKSTETGQIYVHGEKMRIDLTNPDPRTILRNGDSLYIYNPKLRRVEEYDLGKNRALVDQFLLLGFGTPGNELQKSYLVTFQDEETVDNKKTVVLELTPKAERVRQQVSKIQLWIDEGSWLPVQQKFFETGTQDYFVIHYTNLVRNAKIHASRFKPHWPKGTEKVHPQG